jgi:hypothetical protein
LKSLRRRWTMLDTSTQFQLNKLEAPKMTKTKAKAASSGGVTAYLRNKHMTAKKQALLEAFFAGFSAGVRAKEGEARCSPTEFKALTVKPPTASNAYWLGFYAGVDAILDWDTRPPSLSVGTYVDSMLEELGLKR